MFVTNHKETGQLHSGEEIDNLDFSLVPAGVVFGVVTGEDNKPVAEVNASAVSVDVSAGQNVHSDLRAF